MRTELPVLSFQWRLTRIVEDAQMWLVWRLPRWLVRWAVVRATLHATSGQRSNEVVPEVTAIEVMQRWDKP